MKAFLTILSVLALSLHAFGEPNAWSWRSGPDGVSVKVLIAPGCHLYAAKTSVWAVLPDGKRLSPETAPASVLKEDPLDGSQTKFIMPSKEGSVWSFAAKSLSYPVKLYASFEGCCDPSSSEPAACFPPKTFSALAERQPDFGVFAAASEAKVAVLSSASDDLPGFQVARRSSGYQGAKNFLAFLKGESSASEPFAGKGVMAIALLTLLGGLALNLTPCVLPMIPVNLAIIGAGASEGAAGRGKAIARGLLYGAGISLAYGALGLATAIGGASFGQINALWWFNLCAGFVFVALALAMFDAFSLDFSRYESKFKMPSTARLAGVFALGVLAALLAGACVAPLVLAVLLHSAGLYAEGERAGLLLPFILGLGMALPWPLAAAGLSFLPKPGRWMLHVKHVLGVLIALLALYYLWTGAAQLRTHFLANDGSDVYPAAQSAKLDAALAASRADGRPIFIDVGASWCKNCEAMEATTFRDSSVKDALKGFRVLKLRAEKPSEPMTKLLLRRLKVDGLPSYLVLTPAPGV